MVAGRLAAVVLGLLAATGPSAGLTSSQTLDPAYDRGIARTSNGWVVAGANGLARLDDGLSLEVRDDSAIPSSWANRGYRTVGDVDVAGTTLYVPLEVPDRGRQAMARYDATTLAFLDATVVAQHENPFVAVDGASGIAYSMDRATGRALQRYDVRAGWRRLAPLELDRTVQHIRGGAVGRDAVWLASGDGHRLYRVDIASGEVGDVGSAPPPGGVVGGIDAAGLTSGDLHVTVAGPGRRTARLDHLRTRGTADSPAATTTAREVETSWPPALVYFAVLVALVALGAVGTVFWRARSTLRPRR